MSGPALLAGSRPSFLAGSQLVPGSGPGLYPGPVPGNPLWTWGRRIPPERWDSSGVTWLMLVIVPTIQFLNEKISMS